LSSYLIIPSVFLIFTHGYRDIVEDKFIF